MLSTGAEGFVILAEGEETATSRDVKVTVGATPNASLMMLSESSSFEGGKWAPIITSTTWKFTEDGNKSLYVKFSDLNGLESAPFSDSVLIDTNPDDDFFQTFEHGQWTTQVDTSGANGFGNMVGSVWADNKLLVVKRGTMDKWGYLDPASGTWTQYNSGTDIAPNAEAPARPWSADHVALVDGRYLVVMTPSGTFGGGVFDLQTKAWTAVSSTNSPAGNINGMYVKAFGSKAFVSSTGDADFCGSYSPSGNSWTAWGACPTFNDTLAVWNGQDVISWNGTNGFVKLNMTNGQVSNLTGTVSCVAGCNITKLFPVGQKILACGTTGGTYDPSAGTWTAHGTGACGATTVGVAVNMVAALFSDDQVQFLNTDTNVLTIIPIPAYLRAGQDEIFTPLHAAWTGSEFIYAAHRTQPTPQNSFAGVFTPE